MGKNQDGLCVQNGSLYCCSASFSFRFFSFFFLSMKVDFVIFGSWLVKEALATCSDLG
jgi:hypothetical protein